MAEGSFTWGILQKRWFLRRLGLSSGTQARGKRLFMEFAGVPGYLDQDMEACRATVKPSEETPSEDGQPLVV